MKQIQLTQNKTAFVDDSDYDWLNQWKWHVYKWGHTFYATRSVQTIKYTMATSQ